MSDITITTPSEEDKPHLLDIFDHHFSKYDPTDMGLIKPYIDHVTNWNKSFVAKDKTGKVVGGLAIGDNQLSNYGLEEPEEFKGKKGVEGVALAVHPDHMKSTIGRKLKAHGAKNIDADYVWGGVHPDLKSNSLWTKTSIPVVQTPTMNIYAGSLPKKQLNESIVNFNIRLLTEELSGEDIYFSTSNILKNTHS